MGSLGEVFSLHVWVGPESYRLFRKLAAGKVRSSAEFFRTHRSVSVEFVPRGEAEAEDLKLLAAVGSPTAKTGRRPIFRAIRPGFRSWYVTRP